MNASIKVCLILQIIFFNTDFMFCFFAAKERISENTVLCLTFTSLYPRLEGKWLRIWYAFFMPSKTIKSIVLWQIPACLVVVHKYFNPLCFAILIIVNLLQGTCVAEANETSKPQGRSIIHYLCLLEGIQGNSVLSSKWNKQPSVPDRAPLQWWSSSNLLCL